MYTWIIRIGWVSENELKQTYKPQKFCKVFFLNCMRWLIENLWGIARIFHFLTCQGVLAIEIFAEEWFEDKICNILCHFNDKPVGLHLLLQVLSNDKDQAFKFLASRIFVALILPIFHINRVKVVVLSSISFFLS